MQNAIGRNLWKDFFFYQQCHDAESVFWVIVAFLLRAQPMEDQEKQMHDTENADDDDEAGH
jgi:hypothetical protein